MKTLEFDIVECEAGYQAEAFFPGGWTAYSRVEKTAEKAERLARNLADRLGYEAVINIVKIEGIK